MNVIAFQQILEWPSVESDLWNWSRDEWRGSVRDSLLPMKHSEGQIWVMCQTDAGFKATSLHCFRQFMLMIKWQAYNKINLKQIEAILTAMQHDLRNIQKFISRAPVQFYCALVKCPFTGLYHCLMRHTAYSRWTEPFTSFELSKAWRQISLTEVKHSLCSSCHTSVCGLLVL